MPHCSRTRPSRPIAPSMPSSSLCRRSSPLRTLRYVVDQVAAAAGRRAVVAMLGGHVIKVGLGPLLIALLRKRAITVVAR